MLLFCFPMFFPPLKFLLEYLYVILDRKSGGIYSFCSGSDIYVFMAWMPCVSPTLRAVLSGTGSRLTVTLPWTSGEALYGTGN